MRDRERTERMLYKEKYIYIYIIIFVKYIYIYTLQILLTKKILAQYS